MWFIFNFMFSNMKQFSFAASFEMEFRRMTLIFREAEADSTISKMTGAVTVKS